MSLLERNVVVGRCGEVGARLRAGACRHELVGAAALGVAATAEELDAVGDDLDGLALAAAVLRLPLAPLEPSVDCDGAPLREVLRAALGLVPDHRDAAVVRLVDPLARLVLAPAVQGQAEAAHGGAAGRVAELGVAGQVADEHDPVDAGCHRYSSSCSSGLVSGSAFSGAATATGTGSAGTGAGGGGGAEAAGAAGSSRGALVREPSMCFVARWRRTASSIFRTREISSRVSGLLSNTIRW